MTHPQDTTPANPAQGVTSDPIDKAVVEAINALRMEHTGRAYDILHDTLTAAIGAGGQAVAKPLDLSNLLKHAFSAGYVSAAGDDGWTDYDPTKCAAYSRILSALAHPAPSGQAVEALERLRDATPQSTNTVSADGAFAYVHAVAATALDTLAHPVRPGWHK